MTLTAREPRPVPVLRRIAGNNLLVIPAEAPRRSVLRLNETAVHIWQAVDAGLDGAAAVALVAGDRALGPELVERIQDTARSFERIRFGRRTPSERPEDAGPGGTIRGDLSDIYRQAKLECLPIFGGVELTTRCNLRCVHCFIQDNATNVLPAAQWCRILDELAEDGCLHLTIGGGEPCVHPQFLEIYLYAKQKGFLVTLFTNATLLTPEVVEVFARYPPFQTSITSYGSNEEAYHATTRVRGAHARFLRGLDLLEKAGLEFELRTVLLTSNHHDRAGLERFFAGKNQVFAASSIVQRRQDGADGPEQRRLPAEEVVSLDVGNKDRSDVWREFLDRCEHLDTGSLFDCSAGQTAFQVDHCGQVGLCVMYRKPAVSLLHHSFADAWSRLRAERGRERSGRSKCDSCTYRSVCDQCPGWSMTEHGSEEGPVEYLCGIAAARYRYLINNPQTKEGCDEIERREPEGEPARRAPERNVVGLPRYGDCPAEGRGHVHAGGCQGFLQAGVTPRQGETVPLAVLRIGTRDRSEAALSTHASPAVADAGGQPT